MALPSQPALSATVSATLLSIPLASIFSFIIFQSLFSKSRSKPRGKKLGIDLTQKLSNLYDEYSFTPEGQPEDKWEVKSLWIFPIKSCKGIEVEEAKVIPTGLEHDRQFVLAYKMSKGEWSMLTQRRCPKMALISTEVYVDEGLQTGGTIRVSFPKKSIFGITTTETFDLPLNPSKEYCEARFPKENVHIWKDFPVAYNMETLVPQSISQLLGIDGPITAFKIPTDGLREVHRNAPTSSELGWQPVTGFADAYPILLMNIPSQRDLNQKVKNEINRLTILRYRGNVIVNGPPAFEEDSWKKISVKGLKYHVVGRSVRCRLPNVDPLTGIVHPTEPNKTLTAYRGEVDEGSGGAPCLGMNMVPDTDALDSIIRVGDHIKVLERGEHLYIKQ